MCGRLACSLCREDIQQACAFTDKNGKATRPKWVDETGYTYKPFYNGPPTAAIPVLVYKTHFPDLMGTESPDYYIGAMKWGFTPAYKLDSQSQLHTHNSRIETVVKSHMYKPSLVNGGRCVVLTEGFYEWQTTQGASKQPYFIYQNPYESGDAMKEDWGCGLRPKYLMKMAGLFTCGRVEGRKQYSCTIFTTESDSSISWLHHRMPVILNTLEEIGDWLNYKDVGFESILQRISKGFQERSDKIYELKYYKVDKNYVNKTSCDEAKCMERMTVKRLNTLDGWLTPKKI